MLYIYDPKRRYFTVICDDCEDINISVPSRSFDIEKLNEVLTKTNIKICCPKCCELTRKTNENVILDSDRWEIVDKPPKTSLPHVDEESNLPEENRFTTEI